MTGRSRRVVASLTAAAAVTGVLATSAGAATVLVGSPITGPGFGGFAGSNGSTVTLANVALGEPGAHATSPVNGTIVQWRVVSSGTGQYALRVLRPASGGAYTGAGISPQAVTPGDHAFAANLPIQAGDLIGIDLPDNFQGIEATDGGTGGHWADWLPAIQEGSTAAPHDINSIDGQELSFNATVQYTDTPASSAGKKKCKKKKKHKRSAESAKKKCKKKKKH